MVGQYPQNMPQERMALCSGRGAPLPAGLKSALGESKTYVSYVMVGISMPGFSTDVGLIPLASGLNQVNLKLVGCLHFSFSFF